MKLTRPWHKDTVTGLNSPGRSLRCWTQDAPIEPGINSTHGYCSTEHMATVAQSKPKR